jgi:two-component system sensor histidine kinase HydH
MLLLRATIMVTGTLILVVVVSISISKFLVGPLKKLERVARRIRGGHVDDRLEPMSGREAEEVRRTFNLMLDELRDKQAEIVRTATLASVGELSTSIVHELRNPLSSIKMNLQALCKVVEGDENYRELASIASEQVNRLEKMLTDLLQYGRPVELRRELTSFDEVAKATLDVVGDLAKEKEVKIVVEGFPGAKPLHIDKEQMCRVLSNLVINAIQASPPGSKVKLAARNLATDSGSISIEVLDTGCGLTMEAQENVFKPFFSTKPDGTGLGLANVKKIVELHGGTVSARNRSEGGSAFLFTVPDSPAT